MKTYGYIRVSSAKQITSRQKENILRRFPEAEIIEEVYTGKEVEGRIKFRKLIESVNCGDTIVFDEVSRMSRNAEEGFKIYEDLFNRGVNLIFVKQPFINTEVYKKALTGSVNYTNSDVDVIIEGINKYLLLLAKEQIKLAFQKSEEEVKLLSDRTKEALREAKKEKDICGTVKKGNTYETKKAKEAKKIIKAKNYRFNGRLNDTETMKIAEISRPSFYKYVKEIEAEQNKKAII